MTWEIIMLKIISSSSRIVIYRIVFKTAFRGFKIKTCFVSPDMPKARAKNGFNIMIVHFYIRIKLDII